MRAFLEVHALEVALDTRTDFDKLLCAYSPHIFAIDIHIGLMYGLHLDHRQLNGGRLGTQEEIQGHADRH